MEIFNIHLFELVLIASLALVVFGPERLPEVGRFAGKQLARFLAWQQQSPELKMINDVRAEFEQEIASLRDELVRTRNQLDVSQEVNLNSIREELRPMLNLRDQGKGKAAPGGEKSAPGAPPEAAPNSPATNGVSAPDSPAMSGAGAPAVGEADAQRLLTPPADSEAGAQRLPVADSEADAQRLLAPQDLVASAEAEDVGAPLDVLDDPPVPLEGDSALSAAEPAPRTAPEGTVQSATRPNRLAATEPTDVLDGRASALAERRRSLHDPPADDDDPPVAAPPAAQASYLQNGRAPEAPVPDETIALLMRQLSSLSADLQTLISGLQARGVLGADWQPDAAVDEQESLSR